MKVTLKDIASATGFSISTISRALRGEGRISEDHRHKILAAAHELGYELPTTRRLEAEDRVSYIAVITEFHIGEFYASFFNGFSKAAAERDMIVSLFNVSNNLNGVDTLINRLRTLGYVGAVIFVPGLHERLYRQILHATPKDFPLISCSNINNPVLDTVTFDAYRGASLVAAHFLQQGLQSFGLIEGPRDKPEARFRTNGFTDYAEQQSDIRVSWIFKGDYTLERGKMAYMDFKSLPDEDKPEAVFAANDAMAFGFMEAAREDGYVFPNDIALAGYDNLPLCENHYPRLTSVNTNYYLLAKNTLDNLVARIGRPDHHQGIVSLVPVSLEVRQSSLAGRTAEVDGKENGR